MTKTSMGFAVLAVVSVVQAGELRLSMEDYRDKMRGAWIGQMVGVQWGAPTEFKWKDEIIPEDKVPEWIPERIGGGFNNDDLYVEMTFLKTLEDCGMDVSPRKAGIDFANSEYMLWCANLAGRDNLRCGFAPPDCSHPKYNKCPNDIDYQIEADYSGIIAPGLPQEAIRLGRIFGRLMNYGDGVWAGQFVGAMYAKAFFSTDVNAILDAGLAAIPAASDYARMVRDVRAWHREFPSDWTKAWERIRGAYSLKFNPNLKDSNGAIDVRLNGAMIVLGLLYGEGDLDRSMVISMRGGYDSDCNPSNVGGILMCSRGARALDSKYVSKLDAKSKFSFSTYDFEGLCAACEKLARQVVVRYGGRVEKDGDGREWLVIPESRPTPDPWVPSWKAPEPVGSRYSKEEMAAQRHGIFIETLEKLKDPNPTVRVQTALDALFNGWTTSENGPDLNPGFRNAVESCRDGTVEKCILTHPPARNRAVVLSRTLLVPEGRPTIHFEVANVPGGDFRLEVIVDGVRQLKTDVGSLQDGASPRHDFRSFDVSLAPWIGKTVDIQLVNRPTAWYNEGAIWRNICVKANSAND